MELLESELRDKVKLKLENSYQVFEEIGLLSRSIDMVLFDDESLITIEFKIRDWRKAIIQSKDHLIAADYAYLCMPNKKISKDLIELLEKNGIGLWLYDASEDRLIEAITALKSSTQWSSYRNSLIDRLAHGGAQQP